MRFIRKLFFWLAVAVLATILALYFLLQTRWGARQVSHWISASTDYHLAFEKMGHHFSSPSHFLLENVTFGRNGKSDTLVARSVDIGLSSRQFTDPLHPQTILLQNGTLNLSPSGGSLPFKADRLQLNNMAFHSPVTGWDLSARGVTGGISPWQPDAGNMLGKQAEIQMSAGSMTLNGLPVTNILLQGSVENGVIALSTLGADIARGSLSGRVKRHADGSWQIDNLRLTDIRNQSDKSLQAFFAPLATVPSLIIGRLDVTNTHIQGPDWATADLDLTLRNLTLKKGTWQSDDGRLSMHASEFIYGSLDLLDPILNAEFSPQGITLRQFTSRWEGGMVRTSGHWLRNNNALILDDAAFAGLEYTLPENWKQLWLDPLPAWLQSVTLKKFTASRNLVIDIDPAFPWQITGLDGYGDNLHLVKERKWGVWNGSITLNAAAATFNRVDVRRPSLKLTADDSMVNISELSAFTEKGGLEATAAVSQLPQRQVSVSLNGRNVPLDILYQWGWPALPVGGDGDFQLRAKGTVQAGTPLKPTVSGELHAVNINKQEVTQTMNGGELSHSQSSEDKIISPEPLPEQK